MTCVDGIETPDGVQTIPSFLPIAPRALADAAAQDFHLRMQAPRVAEAIDAAARELNERMLFGDLTHGDQFDDHVRAACSTAEVRA